MHTGKKTVFSTNGTGQAGRLPVEEANRQVFFSLRKTQIQVHQRLQHKTRHAEHDRNRETTVKSFAYEKTF